ncbi:MAG: FixH family protein [Alphaproteobacteria bacterium]|nr:FixH family protein [Alphaproteobacteria bacterium]
MSRFGTLVIAAFFVSIFSLTPPPVAAKMAASDGHTSSDEKMKMPKAHGHSDHSGHKPTKMHGDHSEQKPVKKMPKDLDMAMDKLSEHGKYKVSMTSRLNPVAINKMHGWTLQVSKPDGTPIDDAKVKIAGGMPMHGHALPTMPRVTKGLGEGKYLVEGVRFNMAGWWKLKITIGTGHHMDNVTFSLVLK